MSKKPTYEELEQRVRELESLESERKQIAESMRSLNEHLSFYRNAVGSMEDYKIAVVGPDYRYRIVSPQYLKIYNLTGAEIVGRTVAEIMGDDVFEHAIKPNLDRAMKGRAVHYSDWIELSDKGKRYLEVSYYPVVDEDQEVVSVIAMSHDITEKRSVDEALCENEAKYRSLTESMNDILWTADLGMNTTYVSPSIEKVLGFTVEERLKQSLQEHMPPETLQMAAERLTEELEFDEERDPERCATLELDYYHKDGSLRCLETTLSFIRDEHGKPVGIHGMSRDITERKRAEEALQESEEKYRRIYENSVVGFFQSTPEGRFLGVNPAFAKMLGYESPEELVSSVSDIASQTYANPEDRSRYHKALEADGYAEDFELKARCRDDSEIWVSDSSRAEFDEDGKIVRYEGIVVDITDRKRAEEELYKIEAMTKALLNGIPESAFLIESDGTIISANTTVAQRLNCPMEDLIGSNIYTRVSNEVSEFRRKFIDQAVQTGKPFQFEDVRSGRNIDNRINPILDQHGKVTRFAIVGIDITERKRAEEALRESEEQFRALIENMAEGIVLKDASDRFVHWNPKASEVFGIEIDELKGQSTESFERQIIHEDGSDFHKNDLPSLYTLRTGEPCENVVMGIKRGPQDTIWIKVNTKPYTKNRDGKPSGVIISFSDITERKEAEKALKKARDDYQTITNLTGDIIVQADKEGRWTFLNDQACEFWGKPREELIGSLFSDYLHLNDQEETSATILERVRSGDTAKGMVNRQRTPQGWRIVQWNGAPIYRDGEYTGFQATGRDITHQKQAEAERDKLQARLSQAHKMEAIGTLAGGIAHDFNNILSIIVGNTELAMLDVPEWSPAQDNLKEVREATLRARDLVKQILMFSRQKEHTVSNIRLEPIAKESIKMLRASIPTTVKIHTKIKKGLPPVLADPTQIQQIIMNLCTNAGQVMEAEGGILTFTLDSADLEAPLHTVVEELLPGRYVRMQVKDTGPGIPPEILERIFDPFFTTKGVGGGTGLGLAVVHGIVQDRKGGIIVESEEGRGTTFSIYLPASDVPTGEVTVEQKTELPRGTERVLFVDDEPMIMKLGQRMLERLGYMVETRASGTDALECFRQNPNHFDLVVTDMSMPGMRGDRLAEEIMAIRPDIPVILCTGYSRQISKEKAREIGVSAFVMKPLTQHELANTVREVLDEKTRK